MKFKAEVIPGNKVKELNPFKRPDVIRGQFAKLESETLEEAKVNYEAYLLAESQRREFQIQGEVELPVFGNAEIEARTALGALYLEVPEIIADSVRDKILAAFKEIRTAAKQKYPYSEEDMRKALNFMWSAKEVEAVDSVKIADKEKFIDDYLSLFSPKIGSIVEVEEVGNGAVKIVKG